VILSLPDTSPAGAPDWAAVYHDRILPNLGVAVGGQAHPRWIFVCGQPGCGKSTMVQGLCETLGLAQTQVFSSDALSQLLPELYADPDDPLVQPALTFYRDHVRQGYVDALMQRATDMRAHVVWERPSPGNLVGLAAVARAIGYRVECQVFATPPVESWLATLQRETSATDPDRVPRRASWENQVLQVASWAAALARAEDLVAFDEIRIIGRDGLTFFENQASASDDGQPRWVGTPFAFESLMVERLQPRSTDQMEDLVSRWQALRAHPQTAFQNHAAWPWSSIADLGQMLQAMRGDPATGFDLNDPAASPDPRAASGWIERLAADIAAVLASPEAKGCDGLAVRAKGLLALVTSVAGQPTR